MRFLKARSKHKRKRPRNRKKNQVAQQIMKAGIRYSSGQVIEWSKENKVKQTHSEIRYGAILKEMGARHMFRCQQPLFGFIIDFYAPKLMLAVEIDGGYHDNPDQAKYDEMRERKLNKQGISILRFTNEEVLSDSKKVMFLTQEKIKNSGRINKFKGLWRHRNKNKETRDIDFKERFVPDPAFKKVLEVKSAPSTTIMIKRKSGEVLRKLVPSEMARA